MARHAKPVSKRVRKMQFAAIGIFGVLLSYGVLFFCVNVLHLSASVAYVIQAVVCIEANFLLNYRLTWRDRRDDSFWVMATRFHAARVVTFGFNQLLFNSLVWLGAHYIAIDSLYIVAVANTVCIGATTVVNYVVGDRFTFRKRRPASRVATAGTFGSSDSTGGSSESDDEGDAGANWAETTSEIPVNGGLGAHPPRFSVVIPVKNNGPAVAETVNSLLTQDYLVPPEIIIVGDDDDTSWTALDGVRGDLMLVKTDITSPNRDSNLKRHLGLQNASRQSGVLAVVDADVILPPHWMRHIALRLKSGVQAVAGPVSGIKPGFWTDYIDGNPVASKTPRIDGAYLLTLDTIAKHKLPVTANFAMTRKLYEEVGGPNTAFTNSYEDYEWFTRMLQAGHPILCDEALNSVRYHREGLKPLIKEYKRSGQGCADYILAYCRFSPFVFKRLRQLTGVYLTIASTAVLMVFAPWYVLSIGIGGAVLFALYTAFKVRRPAAASYPFISLLLGTMFVSGLTRRLIARPQLEEPTLHDMHVKRRGQAEADTIPTVVRPAQSGMGNDRHASH